MGAAEDRLLEDMLNANDWVRMPQSKQAVA